MILVRLISLYFALFLPVIVLSFPLQDTSEESSIEFVKMEAVSSTKIVHFAWDVNAEKAGDHFLIEKSIDEGETWNLVSRVESIEDHDERHTYRISEINMIEGASELFRIVRVDQSGNSEVLDQVNMRHPVLYNLKIIPDPKKSKKLVTVTCESLIESDGNLFIYDESGDLVATRSFDLADGYNRIELSIRNFKKGKYRFTVQNQFTNRQSRLLTVH